MIGWCARRAAPMGISVFYALFIMRWALPAQEFPSSTEMFRIAAVEYASGGRTKEFALANYINIETGLEFDSIQKLENFIQQKKQHLLNNRIFADSNIEYTVGELKNSIYPVYIHVSTTDTRNFLIVPYPKYDSNTGFLFRLRAWDKNAFGAMNLLEADIGYTYTRENPADDFRHSLLFALDTIYPFSAWGLLWNVDIYNKSTWTFGAEHPFVLNNALGISVNLPLGRTILKPGFRESIVITAKNELPEIDYDDMKFTGDKRISKHDYMNGISGLLLDEWYMASRPYLQWTIPISFKSFANADILYETNISGLFIYTPGASVSDAHKGANIEFSQRLGFAAVNWLNNFRSGAYMYIQNDIIYNFEYHDFNASVSLAAAAYKKIADFFGMSARLRYKHWFGTDSMWTMQSAAEAGAAVRGIRDRSLFANSLLAFNFDFPFRLFVFIPSAWFNTRKLRYFNFELHFSPFVDTAFVNGTQFNKKYVPLKNMVFSFDDMAAGAGFALHFYPLEWRSLFLRFSFAVNMLELFRTGDIFGGDGPEIFFGIGHYY
ncbi:MAG: hypothetical protein LBG74_01750 [Spirochaetaceae bacterium]|jgi:hypothetical protein|nr:hypothetical protein [Spirochaetaceae bacterium]